MKNNKQRYMERKALLISLVELLLSIVAIVSSFIGFMDFKLLILGVILLLISGISIYKYFHNSNFQENLDKKSISLNTKIESKAFIIMQCFDIIILLLSMILYYLSKEELFAILIVFSSLNLMFMLILEIILGFVYHN